VGARAKIEELLVEKYGVDSQRLSTNATMSDLGLDSLSLAELVFDIEDEFGIEIPPEEAEFNTFGEAIALVDRHLATRER